MGIPEKRKKERKKVKWKKGINKKKERKKKKKERRMIFITRWKRERWDRRKKGRVGGRRRE